MSAYDVVQIERLSKRFGCLRVLQDVSLGVPKGSVCTLVGPSGSGKSTLLRCINFLEPYDEGTIYVDGRLVGYVEPSEPRRLRPRREIALMRAQIGMVFQQFNLFLHLTALQNVAVAPIKVRHMARPAAVRAAEELLVKVGLQDRMHAYPAFLSGGEQQRVAIARALAMQPAVLLLDEVTSALDPERVKEVLEVIRALAADGMTMVIVTHEMGFARDIARQVVFMDKGAVIERGGTEILVNPQTARLRSFLGGIEP